MDTPTVSRRLLAVVAFAACLAIGLVAWGNSIGSSGGVRAPDSSEPDRSVAAVTRIEGQPGQPTPEVVVERLPLPGLAVVSGRVVFASGAAVAGVGVRVRISAGEPPANGLSDAEGRFSVTLPAERIREFHLVCEVAGAEELRFHGPATARWDVGDVVIPEAARLDLSMAFDAELGDLLTSHGGVFLVRVVAADSSPRRGLYEDDVLAGEAAGWRTSQWLPIVPEVQVDWGWQAAQAPVPTWIERVRLPLQPAANGYGAAQLVLDATRWVFGRVVAENGSAVPAATVRVTCTPAQGRPRLLVTRTDAAGRFLCAIPAAATVVLHAQVGQCKGDELTVHGGREVTLKITVANHVRLRLSRGGKAVPRYSMGRFHVEDRAGGADPRHLFVREHPDGVVDLGVERVTAGERWVVFAAELGTRLWYAPTDLVGGGAPVEVGVEQLRAAVSMRVRLGPELRSRCPGGAEILLQERGAEQPLRHRAPLAMAGPETVVEGVFALVFDYQVLSGGAVMARGIVDASGGDATIELVIP